MEDNRIEQGGPSRNDLKRRNSNCFQTGRASLTGKRLREVPSETYPHRSRLTDPKA